MYLPFKKFYKSVINHFYYRYHDHLITIIIPVSGGAKNNHF